MNFFYFHVGFMLTATVLLLGGITVARFLRRKRWWLKAHRRTALTGVATMTAGFVSAVMLVTLSGQPHFGPPHTWLGAVTLSGIVLTPTLGFSQFRFPAHVAAIRSAHRWSGRLTLIMALITILFGLILIGIL
ncbi:MAG: hypothetical protein ABFD57_03670 [Smithella sp.]